MYSCENKHCQPPRHNTHKDAAYKHKHKFSQLSRNLYITGKAEFRRKIKRKLNWQYITNGEVLFLIFNSFQSSSGTLKGILKMKTFRSFHGMRCKLYLRAYYESPHILSSIALLSSLFSCCLPTSHRHLRLFVN